MSYLFAKKLKELRQAKDLTLEELARKVNSCKGYLSDVENANRRPPSDKIIGQLAKILGADKKELIRLAHIDKIPQDIKSELTNSEIIIGNDSECKTSLGTIFKEIRQHNKKLNTISIPDSYIPIINNPAGGFPEGFQEFHTLIASSQDHINFSLPGQNILFAIRMTDQSMESNKKGISFPKGTLVFFTNLGRSRDESFIFVAYPSENGYTSTFRKLQRDNKNKICLVPLNPKYPTIIIPKYKVRIWKAVGSYNPIGF